MSQLHVTESTDQLQVIVRPQVPLIQLLIALTYLACSWFSLWKCTIITDLNCDHSQCTIKLTRLWYTIEDIQVPIDSVGDLEIEDLDPILSAALQSGKKTWDMPAVTSDGARKDPLVEEWNRFIAGTTQDNFEFKYPPQGKEYSVYIVCLGGLVMLAAGLVILYLLQVTHVTLQKKGVSVWGTIRWHHVFWLKPDLVKEVRFHNRYKIQIHDSAFSVEKFTAALGRRNSFVSYNLYLKEGTEEITWLLPGPLCTEETCYELSTVLKRWLHS